VITVVTGDLTTQAVDAIVNAANPAMLGGGGVDGAIHRAAGPELLVACRKVPADARGVRCPVGEARITPGFRLPAKHVIHTVGPVYDRDPDPARALASAFRSSLALAEQHGLRTIAFPAISCGAYGYPHDEAAAIAVGVARERPWALDEIRFVLFDDRLAEVFRGALSVH
jgi:O-acetyl-ADP-ribose deacetylase (regulator of RNase III)